MTNEPNETPNTELNNTTSTDVESNVSETTATPAESVAAVTSEPAVEEAKKPNKINTIIGVVVALVAFGLGYLILFTNVNLLSYVPFVETSVATVNGVSISQTEFDNSFQSVVNSMTARGANVNDPGVIEVMRSEAMSQLVNTQLLLQAAKEAGYGANEEEIAEQIAQLEADFGGREALDERLAELNITQEMFKQDIEEQVAVSAYLRDETPVGGTEVTEEEIDEFYANLQQQYGEQLPPREDIETQMIADIQIQKQQSLLSAILADLRADAEIEINI